MSPYRQFQLVYALLVANFFFPAVSYITSPEVAVDTMDRANRLLGGGPWPAETGELWHMLAVGNVMTLAFLCFVLLVDLRRFYPALPGLVFLKGFSASYSGLLAIWHDLPAFWGVLALDGLTCVVMVVFAVRARRDLELGPNLARLAPLVPKAPNRWQVGLGWAYMAHRLLFRPGTVGTSQDPIRRTWRARLLAWRPIRLLATLLDGSVFPLALTGLGLSPEQHTRHLLGAHHDGEQFVYDLQLLALHPGRLEQLREAVREVVEQDTPQSRWLRDLVVFEGYHERLLAAVDDALRGELWKHDSPHPDVSLRAWLSWCAEQPATPTETVRALLQGRLSFAPPALG